MNYALVLSCCFSLVIVLLMAIGAGHDSSSVAAMMRMPRGHSQVESGEEIYFKSKTQRTAHDDAAVEGGGGFVGGAPPGAKRFASSSRSVGLETNDKDDGRVATNRKRVYTADVQVLVKDLDALALTVNSLANAHGGFIVSSSKREYHYQAQFRVEAASLKKTLDLLTQVTPEGNTLFVDHVSQTGVDITDQYEDVDARIRVFNATRETLLELLKKAITVSDVLQVQSQLTHTNQQLDVLLGQRKRMDGDVALSLITINARKFVDQPTHRHFWNAAEQFSRALDSLLRMLQAIASATIYMLVFLPLILIISFVMYLVINAIHRRCSGRN